MTVVDVQRLTAQRSGHQIYGTIRIKDEIKNAILDGEIKNNYKSAFNLMKIKGELYESNWAN